MQETLETEIVEKAKGGDVGAFKVLVEKHQSFAFSVAFKMIGDREDAKDIVQLCFIKVWRHIPNFKKEMKFTTWLYKIIVNMCLDHFKSKQYRRKLITRELKNTHIASDPNTPEKILDAEELLEVVKLIARELKEKQRAVFVLRDLEGMEIQEISKILNMSTGNIKSNLYYARQKVSKKLSGFYGNKIKEQ